MKYFIGIPIPQNYNSYIISIRELLKFKTSEPHITIIPSNILPKDDIFINDLISICSNIPNFNVELNNVDAFDNKIIYIKATSNELSIVHQKLIDGLKLCYVSNTFAPHLAIYTKKYINKINIEKIKKISRSILPEKEIFNVTSIVVYQQKTDKDPYVPYMQIPLMEEKSKK